MFKHRLKLLARAILVAVLCLIAFLLLERWRGQISLAHCKRGLLQAGEKLTAGAIAAQRPQGDNGTPEIFAAARRFTNANVIPTRYPPQMSVVPSGRAIVGFLEPFWVEAETTNHWKQIEAEIRENEAALSAIRIALAKPVFDNQVDLSEGPKMEFSPLAKVKSLTRWFGCQMQLALRERQLADAAPPLIAMIRLPKLLAEDRVVISELVRMAIAAIAKGATWEALHADGWSDMELAHIQATWAELDFIQSLAHGMEGERVFCDVSCETLRHSNDDTYQSIFSDWTRIVTGWTGDEPEPSGFGSRVSEFWNRQIYCRLWRFAWSHQNQRRTLEDLTFLVNQTRTAASNRSYGPVQTAIETRLTETERRNFYDRWRFPDPDSFSALSKAISRAMKAETDRSLTLCAIALKRHFLRHGKYPATLEALVPEFLPSVPIDHMDGKAIKYKRADDDTLILYSVGEDGHDNGGDLSLPDGSRSRDLWRRRDYVWPAPATPEEVAAWREEEARRK